MTPAPIRAALLEAARTRWNRQPMPWAGGYLAWDDLSPKLQEKVIADEAAAVAAFLQALPERFPMPGAHNPDCQVWGHAKGEMRKLAAAVEAAAAVGEGAG